MNSRAEFNRCRIPRLTIEEVDEEQLEEQENKELKIAMEQLEKLEKEWGEERTREREKELRKARSRLAKIEKTVGSRNRKREQDNHKGAAKKRLKYDVEEETWGEEKFKFSSTLPMEQEQEENKSTTEHTGSSHCTTAPGSDVNTKSSSCTTEVVAAAPVDPKSSSGSLVQSSMLKFAVPLPPGQAGTTAAIPEPSQGAERATFEGGMNDKEQVGEHSEMVDGLIRTPVTRNQDHGKEIEKTNLRLNVEKPAPPVVEKCVIKKAYCMTHQSKTEKRSISAKSWKDRGWGRGFGWVTQKTTKYLCVSRLVKNSATKYSEESRNLDNRAGCTMDNLTRVEGCTDSSDVGIILESESFCELADLHTGS